jgi:hypothetical protein
MMVEYYYVTIGFPPVYIDRDGFPVWDDYSPARFTETAAKETVDYFRQHGWVANIEGPKYE